jgi:hypothetical protein
VYIWGTVGGVTGMFRSTDQGASWTRINDDAHQYGGMGQGNFVMGDMDVFGRAYMSTVGRGLVVVESGGSVLPLQFTHVSVSQRPVTQKVYADVKWQTSADAGTTGYVVERSLDADRWQEVYRTTTNGENSYIYSEDVTALTGAIYYRIREINNNGYGSYSSVVTLRLSAITRTTISVRPNPVINKVINLYLNSQAKQQVVVRVVNLFGQTLYSSAVVPVEIGENVLNIPVAQFPSNNICFVEVLNAASESKIATIKVIF